MSQVGNMQNPLCSHDKVPNVDEAFELLTMGPQYRGDYNLHSTWCSGPKALVLKKTPGDDLCSFGSPILWPVQQRVVLLCPHNPVINDDCSSSRHPLLKPHKPLGKSKRSSLPLKGAAVQRCFSRDNMREKIRKQSHCTAWCVVTCSWTIFGFSLSLFLPSTYLPETPFPGRWPSQFASSLSKHFTGERLDLHLSIASHRMWTHRHTHT